MGQGSKLRRVREEIAKAEGRTRHIWDWQNSAAVDAAVQARDQALSVLELQRLIRENGVQAAVEADAKNRLEHPMPELGPTVCKDHDYAWWVEDTLPALAGMYAIPGGRAPHPA